MTTKIGIGSILAAFFVFVFGGISSFMNADNIWVDMTLSSILGDFSDTLVEAAPWQFLADTLAFIVWDLPFAGFLACFGILAFIIGLFVKQH